MYHERLRAKEEEPSLEGVSSYPGQPSTSFVWSETSKLRKQTHSRNTKWHNVLLFCLMLKASIIVMRSVVMNVRISSDILCED
jgi:hypothetical protein